MLCPTCNDRQLSLHTLEGWRLHVCTMCGGLWIGAEIFREAVRKPPPSSMMATKEVPVSQRFVWEESPLNCPQCGKTMKKGVYAYSSGVIIDRCESCGGIWLDRGELAKIRAFLNQETPRERVLMAKLQAEALRRRAESEGLRNGAVTAVWEKRGLGRLIASLRDLFSD